MKKFIIAAGILLIAGGATVGVSGLHAETAGEADATYNEIMYSKEDTAPDAYTPQKVKQIWLMDAVIAKRPIYESYTIDNIADAIGRAEHSTRHPYGIMYKYHDTSPRQACYNTIDHCHRTWTTYGAHGDFLVYLAESYAPIGAANDPRGLNKNWLKNVRWFLTHLKEVKRGK